MNENLSYLEGFLSMQCFLEKYYQQTLSDDVGSLLGELRFINGGETADPAAWHDWLECIQKVKNELKK